MGQPTLFDIPTYKIGDAVTIGERSGKIVQFSADAPRVQIEFAHVDGGNYTQWHALSDLPGNTPTDGEPVLPPSLWGELEGGDIPESDVKHSAPSGLNEQSPDSPNAIHWTRIILPNGTRLRGFTANPIGGCFHGCQWHMPNGQRAICYAKDTAEGLARSAYSEGFEHHYWRPHILSAFPKLKEPAGIFVGSMADVFGHWVPDDQIEQILQAMADANHHTYFLLTKNAPRLRKFSFPPNVWLGVSVPPDYMYQDEDTHPRKLSDHQKYRMLEASLKTLAARDLPVRWVSFEPLSWDVSEIVERHPGAIQWAVIGAASNGPAKYPPDEAHLKALLKVLDDQGVPVNFKGNLKSLPWAAANWREQFPTPKPVRAHRDVGMNSAPSAAPSPDDAPSSDDADNVGTEYVPSASAGDAVYNPGDKILRDGHTLHIRSRDGRNYRVRIDDDYQIIPFTADQLTRFGAGKITLDELRANGDPASPHRYRGTEGGLAVPLAADIDADIAARPAPQEPEPPDDFFQRAEKLKEDIERIAMDDLHKRIADLEKDLDAKANLLRKAIKKMTTLAEEKKDLEDTNRILRLEHEFAQQDAAQRFGGTEGGIVNVTRVVRQVQDSGDDAELAGWLAAGWTIMPELTLQQIDQDDTGGINFVNEVIYLRRKTPQGNARITAAIDAALSAQADPAHVLLQPADVTGAAVGTPFSASASDPEQVARSFNTLLLSGLSLEEIKQQCDAQALQAGLDSLRKSRASRPPITPFVNLIPETVS